MFKSFPCDFQSYADNVRCVGKVGRFSWSQSPSTPPRFLQRYHLTPTTASSRILLETILRYLQSDYQIWRIQIWGFQGHAHHLRDVVQGWNCSRFVGAGRPLIVVCHPKSHPNLRHCSFAHIASSELPVGAKDLEGSKYLTLTCFRCINTLCAMLISLRRVAMPWRPISPPKLRPKCPSQGITQHNHNISHFW